MKLKELKITALLLFSVVSMNAQCLNGGCEVGMSRESIKNGVFIGHYEDGERSGLGISYIYNPEGSSTQYVDYLGGKKTGVQYQQDVKTSNQQVSHTFQSYSNGILIYPALRITKVNKKAQMEVLFTENEGWRKYDGDEKVGELEFKSVIHDGSPVFLAFNEGSQVMAVSATVAEISLLSSEPTEKFYSGLQVSAKEERLIIDIFPRAGADETVFRTSTSWDMKNPSEGLWLYKRYFNDKLSYKFTFEDVLELPSARDIKQQKLQKAFDFIAQQVEDYNFEKGYEGKAKDFIDTLKDIKERAERKGLEISQTYDITMVKLNLLNNNRDKAAYYIQTAYLKSTHSLNVIRDVLTAEFKEDLDLLDKIKFEERLASKEE